MNEWNKLVAEIMNTANDINSHVNSVRTATSATRIAARTTALASAGAVSAMDELLKTGEDGVNAVSEAVNAADNAAVEAAAIAAYMDGVTASCAAGDEPSVTITGEDHAEMHFVVPPAKDGEDGSPGADGHDGLTIRLENGTLYLEWEDEHGDEST